MKEGIRAAPVGDRGAPRKTVPEGIEGDVDSIPNSWNRGAAGEGRGGGTEEKQKQSRRTAGQTVTSSMVAKVAARTPSPSSACGVAAATRTEIRSPTRSPRCGNTVVLK